MAVLSSELFPPWVVHLFLPQWEHVSLQCLFGSILMMQLLGRECTVKIMHNISLKLLSRTDKHEPENRGK